MALFNKVFSTRTLVLIACALGGVFYEKPGRLLRFQLGNCSGSSIRAIARSHPSGLPTVLSDVRYWMDSRRHLLAKNISGFDPLADMARSRRRVFVSPTLDVASEPGMIIRRSTNRPGKAHRPAGS